MACVAPLVEGCLSNAASLALRVFRRVKGHYDLLKPSPLSNKTSVRQVVLDRWFPSNGLELVDLLYGRLGDDLHQALVLLAHAREGLRGAHAYIYIYIYIMYSICVCIVYVCV